MSTFLMLMFISTATFCQDLPIFIQGRIDSLVADKKVPGIFVAVSEKGKHSYYTAGLADKDRQLAFTAETQFEVGSITKTFNAFVVLSVLTDKGLSLDSPIGPWLPDSVRSNQAVAKIPFKKLLNHTSGLPRLPGNMKLTDTSLQPCKYYGAADMYSFLRVAKPDSNAKYVYSNLAAGLAGELATRISGKSYDELVARYVTKPFNMPTTSLGLRNDLPAAIGWFDEKKKAEYWDLNVQRGAGGIHSTADDMLRYAEQMIARQDREPEHTLTTETVVVNDRISVALGWHLLKHPGQSPFVWHNGGTYGFSTFLGYDKESGKAIFIVINTFNANAHSDKLGIDILNRFAETK